MGRSRKILCVVMFVLSACSGAAPYVYNPASVDRGAAGFSKPLALGDGVTVCHSPGEDDFDEVTKLAQGECAREGLVAVFRDMTYEVCPVDKIYGATYRCLDPMRSRTVKTPLIGIWADTPSESYATKRPKDRRDIRPTDPQ